MKDILPLLLKDKKNLQSQYWQDFLPLGDSRKLTMANRNTLVEKVLVSNLTKGNSSAFSCIFTAYYKDLVIFASRFTKDLDSAEEIVQDSFVRLWEEHETINVNISLKSFLLKTVQNKCIDSYRHKKIMQEYNNYAMGVPPQTEYNTDSYILHSELQEQIEAALDKLPKEMSDAFRMNRYKGLKYNEIAEIMGVSLRTIEVRIGKVLHMLSNHLKEYFIFIIGCFSLFLTNMH
jgi:RNA polymerase sigma-70 factor (ECF subfamily)